MDATDPRCLRLSELSQCAYRLGLAFGDEAERAEDHARRLEYFQLFDRCFFAVRVATALELRLARSPVTSDEASTDREDRRERDRDDDCDRDRDRDREREVEPASLPVLLRTLGAIAVDASVLPGPEPAALPTLRELLAGLGSPTAVSAPDLRTRLTGSAATTVVTRPRPLRGGSPALQPIRRATGPPRR